jgi:hypothetical protein
MNHGTGSIIASLCSNTEAYLLRLVLSVRRRYGQFRVHCHELPYLLDNPIS